MSPAAISSQRVLIVGGGIGGLALAQGLHKHGIEFDVFERDANSDARFQGYRVKLMGDAASDLKSLLSEELLKDFYETCAETRLGETTINVLDLALIASRPGRAPPGAPIPLTVDRAMFRSVLMKGIEDRIHFGKAFSKYEETADGVTVYFEDGSTASGSLLVGADGSRSNVRKQFMPDHKPVDTEGCCIYGKSPLTPELLERLPARYRRYITVAQDRTPYLSEIAFGSTPITFIMEQIHFTHRDTRNDLPEDYLYWALLFGKKTFAPTDELVTALLNRPPKELSLWIAEEWHDGLRAVLEAQDESQTSAQRVISAKPEIPIFPPSDKVTLIGDAVHVMSPAGGVGAVTTIKDAFTLSNALAEGGFTTQAIGKYVGAMRAYAPIFLQRSGRGGKALYNAPDFADCKPVEL